jgi:catechol 2,3-dioxygenase-like lactoylglutathione lyase family enzyme
MKPLADRFDHIVLTVNDIDETVKFYERVLDFEKEVFPGSDGKPRYAMRFGNNKINLQDRATDVVNKAQAPTFGSGDFCLVAAVPLERSPRPFPQRKYSDRSRPYNTEGRCGPDAFGLFSRPRRQSRRSVGVHQR